MAMATLVTHELGHLFEAHHGNGAPDALGVTWSIDQAKIMQGDIGGKFRHTSDVSLGNETFADMFSAWVYGAWATSSNPVIQDMITRASGAMNSGIASWRAK
jgi:hypothetical protein